jgi:hypothetical protein
LLRIPAHLQEVTTSLALGDWVGRKVFPRNLYFETIDRFVELLRRHDPASELGEPPLDAAVVTLLAAALDREGELVGYVLKQGTVAISDEQTWLKICQAASWEIFRAHALAVNKGEWPK